MRVCLYQIDGTLPNLALMKLSAWQRSMGNNVIFYPTDDNCDRRDGQVHFASVLFSWNRHKVRPWMIAGGPGWDPGRVLPPEADECFPDYSLYPGLDESYGFTWRGCTRGCGFCVVGKSPHGSEKRHRSIWTFHPPEFKRINLLNNNTLQDPEWRSTFDEINSAGLTVIDHNGYDARLITEESARVLSTVKWGGLLHFAFDNYQDKESVIRGAKIVAKYNDPSRVCFYVLVGYDSTPEEDLERVNLLRQIGFICFVMQYRRTEWTERLARWCNRKRFYFTCEFKDFNEGLARPTVASLAAEKVPLEKKITPRFLVGGKSTYFRVRTGGKRSKGKKGFVLGRGRPEWRKK